MKAQESQHLRLLREAAIQGQLTIVIGSAVSLKDMIAPGVYDFIKILIEELTIKAETADPINNYSPYYLGKLARKIVFQKKHPPSKLKFLLNKYCGSVTNTKTFRLISSCIGNNTNNDQILENIKFEELLRLCIDNGVDAEEILKVVYKGNSDSYNLNHSALAFLANQYNVTLLTTNFDLGVENAGFKNSVVPKNGKWILRDKPKFPVLAKLHGCAEKGEFVATSKQLLSMQSREEFSFIKHWCSSGIVLFLGYSGTGDIDIAPHFKQLSSTTKMLWANHIDARPPFDCAEWVSCDLLKDDSRNLLLQLASGLGLQRQILAPKIHLNLNELISHELKKISPFVAARCLVDIIGRFNPKIFLIDYIVTSKLNIASGNKEQFLNWCINRKVDPPPLRTGHNNETRRMLNKLADIPGAETYRSIWYIFADWRTGKQTRALEESARLVNKETTTDIEVQLKIYEIFLAIIAERLWGSADKMKRQSILQNYKTEIDVASNALKSTITNEKQNLESYFSGQLRVYEVAFWKAVSDHEPVDCLGAKAAINELIKLRNQAVDLEVNGVDVSIDHFLIGINSFCSQYLTCTNVSPEVYKNKPFAPKTIFTLKKRFAYKHRFQIFGRYIFQFLEIQMLGLWEFYSRELTLVIHIINLRWKCNKF